MRGSPAQRITEHFGGDWHATYGTFPAPGHSKDDRGMSIEDKPDGDVLINSFNGGDPMAVKDECRKLGLIPDRPTNAARAEVTGTYVYRSAVGEDIFRTVRKEKPGARKQFVAEHLQNGRWAAGMGNVDRVPYRLPELMAGDPAEPVYFVEGERKADKLASMGFTATCVPFGCKGWREDYAQYFVDRTVRVLPDNDDEGRAFAQRVLRSINSAGGHASILDLSNLPPKGDIMDWAGSADDLRRLTRAAAISEPMDKLRAASGQSLELPVEHFIDIKPNLTGRALIKGLLMERSATAVYGFPGCGKTFLVLDWLLHIAAARDWFGRRVKPGAALYIPAEGQGGARKRIAAWRQEHGLDDQDIPFAMIPTSVNLFDPAAGDLAKLQVVIEHHHELWGRLDLIAIDTLSATIGGGDENAAADMSGYVGNIRRLCEPYGCGWIVVTHVPLNGDAKRPRGSGSLMGTIDTGILVSGDRDAPARRIQVTKQKDDDPGPDILFQLKQVVIGTDEEGGDVTSCVVEQSDLEPCQVRGRRKLTPKEQIVFAALERALVATGVFPPTALPDYVCDRIKVGKVVSMSGWQSEALAALSGPDTKADTAARTFRRARERLQASEIIALWEEWAWLV